MQQSEVKFKVLKFGGTSVANAGNIGKVKDILASDNSRRLVVVVSALGGITDQLLDTLKSASERSGDFQAKLKAIEDRHLDTIRQLLPLDQQSTVLSKVKHNLNELETLVIGANLIGESTDKLKDRVVSYGELLSSFIITKFLQSTGLDAALKDGRELIVTNEQFGKASVDFDKSYLKIDSYFKESIEKITVVPGFVASSENGEGTTLGRGGSDYTAAILAGAAKADILEIWTDVSGLFTANPKLVKQARCVKSISYEEAMELSHFGAKVLYAPTIQPVLEKGIPLKIKNTFEPGADGTLVSNQPNGNGRSVKGISHIDGISLLSLEGPGMVGVPGISKRFFGTLSQADISVVLITQASSEHSICAAVPEQDASRAKEVMDAAFEFEISKNKIMPLKVEQDLSIIALVGDQMKSHQGLSGKMFSTLGKNNVNIRAIAQGASERNISAVIADHDVKKALNTLHEEFFENHVKQINLFIVGVGNVGEKLLDQLKQQQAYLKEELRMNLRVAGLANSKQMVFDEDGIDLTQWKELLKEGEKGGLDDFHLKVQKANLRNSIFVDNTASDTVSNAYGKFLKDSVAVVTCNKIACSSEFGHYQNLKRLSKKYNAAFLYETNVGAGLPIIDTLKHLITSGDKVHKIQAVLSGSLNFVFNNYDGQSSFHDVVKRAQEEGYTEPNPLIDLSGTDVMRKILILARESGYPIEMTDIVNNAFLPENSLNAKDTDSFFETLKENEQHFKSILNEAQEKGCRLKYVAQFENGKASVGLQQVQAGHDFYQLEGSDNIVVFYTDRYREQPLIVKGAGAGASVTASGIFADIIRTGNF